MSTLTFQADSNPRYRVRSTIAALAIAAAGYVAGALVQPTLAPRGEAGAIAQPARAAQIDARGPAPTLTFVPRADDSRALDPEWTLSPRECNVELGITTACMFLD